MNFLHSASMDKFHSSLLTVWNERSPSRTKTAATALPRYGEESMLHSGPSLRRDQHQGLKSCCSKSILAFGCDLFETALEVASCIDGICLKLAGSRNCNSWRPKWSFSRENSRVPRQQIERVFAAPGSSHRYTRQRGKMVSLFEKPAHQTPFILLLAPLRKGAAALYYRSFSRVPFGFRTCVSVEHGEGPIDESSVILLLIKRLRLHVSHGKSLVERTG